MSHKVSDGIVHPRTILNCVLALQRQGTQPAKLRLEATEPDLAEYLLESLSTIHQELQALHAHAGMTRRVYHRIAEMSLVCIEALRQSHAELWDGQISGVTKLDESPVADSKPS